MTTEAFQGLVKDWLAAAKAPLFNRPYTDLVFQSMLEVMKYLRKNGFRTYSLPAEDRNSSASRARRFMASA
jgi:hypothetical protein